MFKIDTATKTIKLGTGHYLWEFIKLLVSSLGVILLIWFIFQVRTVYNDFITIRELQSVIKNLKASYPIADFTVMNVGDENRIRIHYYRANGEIVDVYDEITIKGEHIYIDCDVYNFSYSLIETGEASNIAIPTRIYSDLIAPDEAITLNNCDSRGIPYSLFSTASLADQALRDVENKRLTRLLEILNDEERSEKLGIIRLPQKVAVANASTLRTGSSWQVRIENTGGITLRRK